MRIQSLEITNIASLKGRHFIDFNEIYPFTNTFAITGETGAGKSSILNAISMALYSKNYNSNINQTDLITLGETYGDIKLNFKIKDKEYLATWYCKVRKKNKELLKTPQYKKSLSLIDKDNEIELSKSADEVIGLSFDQFCKTIILNQGQFSDFLLSTFTERKKILETLYSQIDLSQLSRKNQKAINETNAKLKNIDSKVDGLSIHEEVDIKDLESQKEILNQEVKNLNKQQEDHKKRDEILTDIDKSIINIQNTKSNIEGTKKKLEENTTQINTLKSKLDKDENSLSEIKRSNKVQIPKLHKYKELKKDTLSLKKQILELETESKNIKEKLQLKDNDKEEIKKRVDSKKKELENVTQNSNFYKIKESNLNEIEYTLTQIKNEHQQIDHREKELKLLKSRLDEHKKSMTDYESKSNLLDPQKASQDLEHKKKKVKQVDDKISKLNKDLVEKESKQEQLKKNELKSKKLHEELEDLKSSLKLNEAKLKDQSDNVETLKRAIKSFELESMIAQISKESIEAKHCLICNSEDLSKIDIPQINTQKEDYEAKLIIALDKKESLEKEIRSLSISTEHKEEVRLDLLTQIEQLNKLLTNQSDPQQIEELKKQKEKLQSDINNLTISLRDLDEIKKLLIKEQSAHDNLKPQIDELTHQLKQKQDSLQKNKSFIKTTLSQDSFSSKELGLWIELSKLYYQVNKDIKNLLEIESRIIDENKELNESLDILKKKILTLSDNKDKLLEKVPTKYLEINIDHEVLDLEKELDKYEAIYSETEKDYNHKKIEIAEYKSKMQMLADQEKSYESSFITLKDNLQNDEKDELSKALNKLSKLSSLSELNMDIFNEIKALIQAELLSVRDKLKETNETYAQNELLIKQYKKTKILIEQSLKEKEHLIKHLETLRDLHNIVGKDEFRNYVLSIIEKNLIIQTNHELRNLCGGRYKIFQKITGSNGQSDFYIEDTVNYAMDRKISTLSGGETFMVSLAMALALAEMTKGQTEIESFFIDEGF